MIKYDDKEYNEEGFISEKRSQFLSKFDNELYIEASNTINKLINIKYISLPNNGGNWEIYENDELIYTVSGIKLTKLEKNKLKTVEGIKLLMNRFKNGNITISNIKKALKEIK